MSPVLVFDGSVEQSAVNVDTMDPGILLASMTHLMFCVEYFLNRFCTFVSLRSFGMISIRLFHPPPSNI